MKCVPTHTALHRTFVVLKASMLMGRDRQVEIMLRLGDDMLCFLYWPIIRSRAESKWEDK